MEGFAGAVKMCSSESVHWQHPDVRAIPKWPGPSPALMVRGEGEREGSCWHMWAEKFQKNFGILALPMPEEHHWSAFLGPASVALEWSERQGIEKGQRGFSYLPPWCTQLDLLLKGITMLCESESHSVMTNSI